MHYVVGFQFDLARSRVALVRKNRPTWQYGLWNGIGGHVEPGETSRKAMLREFEEETGAVQHDSEWKKLATIHTWTEHQVSVFHSFTDRIELVKTATDELVSLTPVVDLALMGDKLVPTVSWLVAMSLSDRYWLAGGDGRLPPSSYTILESPPSEGEDS